MKIERYKRRYSKDYETRRNASVNDIFAVHITFEKIAFGIVLKKFYDYISETRKMTTWHTFTIKLWKTDYVFRFTNITE